MWWEREPNAHSNTQQPLLDTEAEEKTIKLTRAFEQLFTADLCHTHKCKADFYLMSVYK